MRQFCGWSAMMVGAVWKHTLNLPTFLGSNLVPTINTHRTMGEDVNGFIAGWFAGCGGLIVSHPIDTVRVRLQTQGNRYLSATECFREIIVKEKVKGLYKGITYPLLGQAAINAILFGIESMTYARLQNGESSLSIKNSVVAGLCAGAVQTVIVCPMELVKIRMQNQSIGQQHVSWAERKLGALSNINDSKDYHTNSRHRNLFQNYRGPIQTTRDIIHKEGLRGMFKGWWITLFREVPQFGIYFGTYAWLRLRLSQITGTSPDELGAHYLSLAGGVTGVVTWCWYPIDVIKARIQNDGGVKGERRKYSGVVDCVRKSIRSEGVGVLFKGIQPSLVRGFFNGFATFPVFTLVSQFLNGENNYHYY